MPKEPSNTLLRARSALHWEHGYRCHGYWTDDNKRLGVVGLGPRNLWDGIYRWEVKMEGRNSIKGESKTLRHAKNMVQRWVAAELKAQNNSGQPRLDQKGRNANQDS